MNSNRSKSRFVCCLAATAIVAAAAVQPVAAEETVGGFIRKDTRWTEENGPYYVTQDVFVVRGVRLSIMPGTRIVVGKLTVRQRDIPQNDAIDSSTVAITVEGSLDCVGRPDKRITFLPQDGGGRASSWYGIVLKKAADRSTQIGYTNISGAYKAVSVYDCSPVIHHCQVDFNNEGIVCGTRGDAEVSNCVVAHNFAAGVKVASANPVFVNNIIAFNRNNGLWCDGVSTMTFEYNCVFGNADGNLLDCDPELGVLRKKNDGKDSVDYRNNLFRNPVFAGSEFDSVAVERDLSLGTDRSRVRDTSLAKVLHNRLSDSLALKKRAAQYPPYALSRYSPCLHAGTTSADIRNEDGSRSDMGMYGGTKFSSARKK
jgi:hypothetical protein